MKDRVHAFLIHALLSALLLCVTFALIALVWYPAPLFLADGGREVIMLISLVDLVAGPALTFAVYRKGKKSLPFDLSVIAVIQLAALAYGTLTMYQQRPVFVAFTLDRFYTVTAEQVETQAPRKLKDLTALMPQASNWVYVEMPQDKNALREFFLGQGEGENTVLSLRSDFYQPLNEARLRKAMNKSVDIRILIKDGERKTGERDRLALEDFIAKHRIAENDIAFLPLVARYRQMFAAYRKSDASLIGFLEIQPDLLNANPE